MAEEDVGRSLSATCSVLQKDLKPPRHRGTKVTKIEK